MFYYILSSIPLSRSIFLFFFNDTATTEIYTLSLHDALPISLTMRTFAEWGDDIDFPPSDSSTPLGTISKVPVSDRKSTRLNSSHLGISYAVFCLKKKKNKNNKYNLQTKPQSNETGTHVNEPW